MHTVENISHIYKGLLERNRAYASFKIDELDTIFNDIEPNIKKGDWIIDPMSGYGGLMQYFGKRGYKTYNIEINPPAYYWQVLINPQNSEDILKRLDNVLNNRRMLPRLKSEFSISDTLFTVEAYEHIKRLYEYIKNIHDSSSYAKDDLDLAILLPFVSRFANYIKREANRSHIKEGGFCSYTTWKDDFIAYVQYIKQMIEKEEHLEIEHENVLGDILEIENKRKKFKYFITSPPYPNYRDYSKIFKIENRVLKDVFKFNLNFNNLMGSNNVSGKIKTALISESANVFLEKLIRKSKSLQKKPRRDIESYYHPYFAIYFTQIQNAFTKFNNYLSKEACGYIVVNDNIIRDISVPVGDSICDILVSLGFDVETIDNQQVAHYGNIGSTAKRINSLHTRHILKAWRK